jgi:hypothetical protein
MSSTLLKRTPSLLESKWLSNLRQPPSPFRLIQQPQVVQSPRPLLAPEAQSLPPQKLSVCHSWVCLQVEFNMSSFSGVMKGGWHPKGKDGGKESWRGDFKGINQVVSYAAEAVCHQIP